MASLPTVTALIAASNQQQYVGRALQSALRQDYPAELLDVIVIDGGSIDSTGEIVRELAEANPGRVRLVRQANAGSVAVIDRAVAEGTGEMLALLDADDMWLPQKTRRQVEMLREAPELGLVFSDMSVVDADDNPLRPSIIWAWEGVPERGFARVLHENVAAQSSIMFRASLREHVVPIPPGIPYADWWIALRSAQFSRIDYSREPLALYRVHGASVNDEVGGPAQTRDAGRSIAFQLWVLRNLPLDLLTPEEMIFVWNGVEAQAERMVRGAGTLFIAPSPPAPELASQVAELRGVAEQLEQRGDFAGQAEVLLRALAYDPFAVGARERLQACVTAIEAAALLGDPLHGARTFVALADAEELLAREDMLLAYAGAMSGDVRVTLAIDATRLPAELAGAQLRELAERCAVDAREDIELFAVVGERAPAERRRLMAGVSALYRREAAGDGRLPVFTPETVAELRRLADGAGD